VGIAVAVEAGVRKYTLELARGALAICSLARSFGGATE
jgi:hypothetical protein